MKRNILLLSTALLLSSGPLLADTCSDAKIDFTFYGAKDKSYVVTKNTFKSIKITGDKLEGATAEIDLMSLDTSADLNNGKAVWPTAMGIVRDMNTKNGLFKKMTKGEGKAIAKITKVEEKSLDVEITMNGKTETIKMETQKDGDTTVATGKLDIVNFAPDAFANFAKLCAGFHKGFSHSEIDLILTLPKECK
jgi:hypothetical protein